MPSVPYTGVPEVKPANEWDVRSYATPQAFGAGIGTAVSGVGKDVEKFGDVLAAHALKLQGLENQATADQAMSDYIIKQAELDSQHKTLEGKARADAYQSYVEKSQALREQYSATMPNKDTKRLFDSETRKYYAYSIRNEAGGVATELKKYRSSANQRLVSTAEQTIIGNPESDQVFEEAATLAKRGVRQEATERGWDETETENKVADTESSLLKKRLTTLAERNPDAAQELLEKNKDRLIPTDRNEVETSLAAGRNRAGTQAAFLGEETKKLVKTDINSMLATGKGVPGLNYNRVKARLGDVAAEQWKVGREDAEKIWWHTYDVDTLPEDRMQTQLRNLTPTPGSPDYDRQVRVFNAVKEKFDEKMTERRTDPAASVSGDPLVKDAETNFDKKDPDSWGVIIDARLGAQTKAGIPEDLQAPITVKEGAELMAPLLRALPGEERGVLDTIVKDARSKFGSNWEQAFEFAIKAQRLQVETQRRATNALTRGSETENSTETIDHIVEPEAKPPAPKPSLSKKILETFPPTKAGMR